MKRFAVLLATLIGAGVIAISAPASGHADEEASPIYGVAIPPGYRDWKLIAVAQLKTDNVDQMRAQLGNEIAVKAYKEGTRPFPDGAIIVPLHWNRVPSEDNNRVLAGAFPGVQSFVVGSRVNMQVMVKDSKNTRQRVAGASGTSRTAKPATRRCTRLASPATNLPMIATLSSLITQLETLF